MTHDAAHMSQNDDAVFDLSGIFIARQQQLDLFEYYLSRWKQLIFDANSDDELVEVAPSPNNKIQGLIVLLYGRGGFGKSTLLIRFHNIILKEQQQNAMLNGRVMASKIVDWEFAIGENRGIYNPAQGQAIDSHQYFKALCGQLAIALHREPKDFKKYQTSVKDVEKARKEANGVLDRMKQDDRYGWLRSLTVDTITMAVRTFVPGSSVVIDFPGVKTATNEVAKITQDQLGQIHERLHDKLGTMIGDYLDPSLRLGLALGEDLHDFARNFPLLIFFDTYEEVDEGDRLLRIVMGAAGLRVGWVMAGRDNLWAGIEQSKRSTGQEYGYKDIVFPNRGLPIDFDTGGIGAFTTNDIQDYFLQVAQQIQPSLPKLTEDEASNMLEVTRGVPLAVKLAAGIYVETGRLDAITIEVEKKSKIVEAMVLRYMLHTRMDMSESAKMYGLALLRRADQPEAVAAALALEPEQAASSYRSELSRLQRRYSFIFTEKAQPSLHQEVRYFLRLWLLEHREEPEIEAVNKRLKETHEKHLLALEEDRHYTTLKDRLIDDEWVGTYLDLAEQQFWLDPAKGVNYTLPFMLAAAIYRRESNAEAADIGNFFKQTLKRPYSEWWGWAYESLPYISSKYPSEEELAGLKNLEMLTHQRCPAFPKPVSDYTQELEAALWWRIGEAYVDKDNVTALQWYEKALERLGQEVGLKEDVAETYYAVGLKLYEEKKYKESLTALDRAIELKPNYFYAYGDRGAIYDDLLEFEQAIADYSKAIDLDPTDATAYYNRGLTYAKQQEYSLAFADYSKAIELNPTDAKAYYNRGNTYLMLRNSKNASSGLASAWKLNQSNVNYGWMAEWATMSRDGSDKGIAERLEKIAEADSKHYVAFVCRGVALGLRGKLKEGLAEIERAIPLEPEEYDHCFWKGMLCAYYYKGRYEVAIEAIEKALEQRLPPVLLTPLYWLERDRPDFFERYARPLLEKYEL